MEKVHKDSLPEFVRKVLVLLPQKGQRAAIVALQGELGAGKTTFVQVLAKELGVKNTVQSPTYVLMKRYDISYRQFNTLVHIDLYRLEKSEEFAALKPEEFLNDQKNLVCIEWPERAGNLLPKPNLTIRFSSDGVKERERYIEVT